MNCPHLTKTLVLTPELAHYGKRVCDDCGTFCGWAKKPETEQRLAENARRLAMLCTVPLPEWEKGFVASLRQQGQKISPRQQEKLDAIYAQHAR